ncbi:DUF1491 family protein [Brucella pseudogrignonensis]|jgi:hypothetical protein|uniref:DUF1491 family protein n=1 Tax=Brucella/Ochrobactrum group TaxID=2826938 RepID=UPI0007DA5556|nr:MULTISPECIES: DUF1491 family protein [Brucella]ANG95468.1 hypothetical protein A8A54_02540 [Brucella pseudogrignonensis]MBO1024304.1 DUF1491 family protein [Ochrobactrum sp. SD129]MCD4511083.1 DUF1491 family protein [Brucella pseudogrignonensis]QWK78188.1 DUF1491 family protein [Ochrobactrum sp. BTU1]
MRLTSDFWVSALIRKVQGEGGFAYLARRGSKEAGAIFIKVSSRFGTCDLYSPAPQTSYEENTDGERMFLRILHDVDDVKASERMDREVRFDPDLWLIELEDIADPEGFFSVSKDEL